MHEWLEFVLRSRMVGFGSGKGNRILIAAGLTMICFLRLDLWSCSGHPCAPRFLLGDKSRRGTRRRFRERRSRLRSERLFMRDFDNVCAPSTYIGFSLPGVKKEGATDIA